jgi:hypothetical protein
MPCFFPDVPDVRPMAHAVGKWNGANQLYLESILLAKMNNMRWLAVVDVKIKSISPPSQGASSRITGRRRPESTDFSRGFSLRRPGGNLFPFQSTTLPWKGQ